MDRAGYSFIEVPITSCIDIMDGSEPRSIIRMWHELAADTVGASRFWSMANTRNELDRHFPWLIPMVRDMGREIMPAICYYPSPRTTDEYYANLTKRIMAYKPDALMLKDAGGLLTVEREVAAHPDVQEAVCIGVPSEFGEDDVQVFVVVREGVTLDPEALIRFLTPLIPANMVPLFVEIVAEFPKTETMKVKKFQLKNMGNNDRTWDREAVEA